MARHMIEGDAAAGDLTGAFPSPLIDTKVQLNRLPRYSSLALALAGTVSSGDYFVLTGVAVGLSTVNLVCQAP